MLIKKMLIRERERERDRQTDRQTSRQIDREMYLWGTLNAHIVTPRDNEHAYVDVYAEKHLRVQNLVQFWVKFEF